MSEQERKMMMNLADTIKGEINRMCVTKELSEFQDTVYIPDCSNITAWMELPEPYEGDDHAD